MKKDIDLKYTLQLGGLFLILLVVGLVFGSSDTEPIWNREFGDFISEALLMILFIGVFLLLFYIYMRRKRAQHRRFHEKYDIPFANEKGECYCSSEERMDAFLNPHDPILNPRSNSKNRLSEK
ncbi:MAG: hypothetical protein UT08_C0009G0017 [Candidatus Woesebacteria bacterium GW2011_GWB1_38_8]|uniref:Uncharacterized protein n=1 Tax=Candidatus Woesebacteria bacterium GW2011_GWB1_38_8 TaxID=1618570 RepID=A0A0G0KZS5_9BACT|nr:MAG: hypothetical protein UT08_C0009G0017 [Candidatus Woesebacteria bacterium GW2011_GWB1_38_8]